MSKGPCSAYDKWNISVIIQTQIFYNCQPSHGGDHNIFGVMTSPLPKGTVDFSSFVLAAFSNKEILIGATSSGIS